MPYSISHVTIKRLKAALRHALPAMNSSHRTEALARGLGWRNNAGMRAALATGPVEREVNEAAFQAFLASYGVTSELRLSTLIVRANPTKIPGPTETAFLSLVANEHGNSMLVAFTHSRASCIVRLPQAALPWSAEPSADLAAAIQQAMLQQARDAFQGLAWSMDGFPVDQAITGGEPLEKVQFGGQRYFGMGYWGMDFGTLEVPVATIRQARTDAKARIQRLQQTARVTVMGEFNRKPGDPLRLQVVHEGNTHGFLSDQDRSAYSGKAISLQLSSQQIAQMEATGVYAADASDKEFDAARQYAEDLARRLVADADNWQDRNEGRAGTPSSGFSCHIHVPARPEMQPETGTGQP